MNHQSKSKATQISNKVNKSKPYKKCYLPKRLKFATFKSTSLNKITSMIYYKKKIYHSQNSLILRVLKINSYSLSTSWMTRYQNKCNSQGYRLDRFLSLNKPYGRQPNIEKKLKKDCKKFLAIKQHLA